MWTAWHRDGEIVGLEFVDQGGVRTIRCNHHVPLRSASLQRADAKFEWFMTDEELKPGRYVPGLQAPQATSRPQRYLVESVGQSKSPTHR